MKRGMINTLLAVCLSTAVVFGGWFFTVERLGQKEAELLARKGEVALGASGKDIKEKESKETEAEFQEKKLSEDEMATILATWEGGGYALLHEPLEGQMTMEQAILAGKDWINRLAEQKILPDFLAGEEPSFDKIKAVLSTIDTKSSPEEKTLFGSWTITYEKDDVEIILKLHAASGQIWGADIYAKPGTMLPESFNNGELLTIAFPAMKGKNVELITVGRTVYKCYTGGKVYAALKRSSILVNEKRPLTYLKLWLTTGFYEVEIVDHFDNSDTTYTEIGNTSSVK